MSPATEPDELAPPLDPGNAARRFRPLETVTHSLLELSAILENATIGILFTRSRRLVRSNPLCAQMFGYELKEFIGLSGVDLYPTTSRRPAQRPARHWPAAAPSTPSGA
jgi:PAS domain-containing protein